MRDFALSYPYFSILQTLPAKFEGDDNERNLILQQANG